MTVIATAAALLLLLQQYHFDERVQFDSQFTAEPDSIVVERYDSGERKREIPYVNGYPLPTSFPIS